MQLDPSPVVIYNFEVLDYQHPRITLKVKCSKGTYIRALARDFGERLNSGAHLVELRRTAIGDFKVEDAFSLADFEKNIDAL